MQQGEGPSEQLEKRRETIKKIVKQTVRRLEWMAKGSQCKIPGKEIIEYLEMINI